MASNQKVEENRPPLKFNFTYWEVFSGHFVDCRKGLWTCLCTVAKPALLIYTTHQYSIHGVYRLYTGCIKGWKHLLEGKIEFYGGSSFFNFLILGHLTPLKWPLNTNPCFFWDTLYVNILSIYIEKDNVDIRTPDHSSIIKWKTKDKLVQRKLSPKLLVR